MITIDIDAVALKAIDRKLEDMQQAISDLQHTDLANELSEWETADLHRKRAYTKHRRNGGSTIIRQHSWWEVKGRRKVARRLIRKGKFIPRWSMRPVLRPQLLDRLVERVGELAAAKLRW
jgi:hypothetical protein